MFGLCFYYFRIIHDHGFSADDYSQYKPVVFSNAIYSLLTIIRAMDKLRIDFETDERLVRSLIFRAIFFVYQLSYFIYSTGSMVEGLVNRAVVLNIGFTL